MLLIGRADVSYGPLQRKYNAMRIRDSEIPNHAITDRENQDSRVCYWLGLDEKPRELQPKPAGHEWKISNLTAGRSALRQAGSVPGGLAAAATWD